MPVIHLQRKIKASPATVWRVISDLASFDEVAPHVSRVEMLPAGEDGRPRRRLYGLGGYTWTERVVDWREGTGYALTVDGSDSLYPFRSMTRRFELEEVGDGVLVRLHYEFSPKYGPLGLAAHHLFFHRRRRELYVELLNNWVARIRDREWAHRVTVATIMQEKGDEVVTAAADASLTDLSQLLRERRIGAVLIVDGKGDLAGLVSERDVVAAIGAYGSEGLSRRAEDIMTRKLVVCEPGDDMLHVMACMADCRVRHLPVMEGGELAGIISMSDVVGVRIRGLEAESETMREYIEGREWRYHQTGGHDVAGLRQEIANPR